MSAKQAAFLTSRVISLWLAYCAFLRFLSLPTGYLSYYLLPPYELTTGTTARFGSRMLIGSAMAVVQLFVEIFLAILFYRFGPRVARFLLGDGVETGVKDKSSYNS